MAQEEGNSSLVGYIRNWFTRIGEWMKPEPGDALPLRVVKFILKCTVLLLLIAFSPILLIILVFVFFAAF
jgi:hypothetical protein